MFTCLHSVGDKATLNYPSKLLLWQNILRKLILLLFACSVLKFFLAHTNFIASWICWLMIHCYNVEQVILLDSVNMSNHQQKGWCSQNQFRETQKTQFQKHQRVFGKTKEVYWRGKGLIGQTAWDALVVRKCCILHRPPDKSTSPHYWKSKPIRNMQHNALQPFSTLNDLLKEHCSLCMNCSKQILL